MHDKSTRFTLAVTAGFLLILILVGGLLNRRAAERSGTQSAAGGTAEVTSPAPDPEPPPRTTGIAPALPPGPDGQPAVDYQIITGCSLADDAGNDGDSFLITTPDGPFRFSLYGVDAVETDGGSPDDTRRVSEYFGFTSEEQVRRLGMEASDFSLRLLRNCRFRVATKWERDPAGDAYLAFLSLDDGEKGRIDLSMYLVQFGLAMIRPPQDPLPTLPDGTPAGEFILQLQAAEEKARNEGQGAWASAASGE